jgi:hypothetical protein
MLRTRLALDVAWDDAREDVFEATELGLIEARVRRSERLSFTVGVQMSHRLRTRESSTLEAGAVRTELEVAPTAAHVDVTLADPLHLRAGYQSVFLGRFDVLSATNVLARYDLRAGPSALPELSEIVQPALWLDLTPTQGLELRAIYVPFFAPHRFDAFDGDYALSPARQADIDAALEDSAMDGGLADAETLGRALRATVSRSGAARYTEGTFSAFAPDASLAHPQGALRAVWHGPLGEVALTGATALEHLPVFELADAGREPDEPLVQTRYDRLWVAALDGAIGIGPVQLGLELAFQHDRVMFVLEQGELARAERTQVLHGGLRAELIEGETWLFAIEAAIEHVLDDLAAAERYAFSFERRFLPSAVAFVACDLGDIGLRLELGGGLLPGLTYSILPRIEQELGSGLYLELGAVVLGGGGSRLLDQPSASLGAIYEDTDHVYTGLKLLL